MNIVKALTKHIWTILVLLAGVFSLAIVYQKTGMFYETNDDIIISKFYSGVFTGSIDYHTIYNGVLFSAPLSLLYRLFPGIQWYGISILLAKYLSFCLPVIVITRNQNHLINRFFILSFSVVSFFLFLYLQSFPQFTSTASCTAFAGYIVLLFEKEKRFRIAIFAVLELLAYGIRPQSMLMVLPIGFALFAGFILFRFFENKERTKALFLVQIKVIIIPVLTAAFIVFVGQLSYMIAYSGDKWKAALSANDASTILFDYSYAPAYDSVEYILKDSGVTKAEYEAYQTYLNYFWDNSNGALERIADVVNNSQVTPPSPSQIILWLFSSYTEWPWRLSGIVLLLYLLELILILQRGKFEILFINLSYFFSKAIIWGYLYYRGRMPLRITLPLISFEILIELVILLILCESKVQKESRKYNALSVPALLIAGITIMSSYISVREQYRYICALNPSVNIMTNLEAETIDYCNRHADKKYLISDYCYIYWRGSILQRYSSANFRYSSGWFLINPEAQKYVNDYLGEDDFYYISCDENPNLKKQIAFFEEYYDSQVIQYDSFNVCTGSIYYVYKVTRNR